MPRIHRPRSKVTLDDQQNMSDMQARNQTFPEGGSKFEMVT